MMVVSRQSSRHKMWTEITRPKYEREGQRYASDVTDAEWALIEPHMPAAKPLGRPRDTELRAVLDAILYIARTGCQWRMLPKDFPPFTTVQGYFYDWRDNGLFEKINFALLLQAREAAGREPSPSASDLLVEFAELTNTPVVPTLMGWGAIPDDHRLNAGMVGLQTQHRYGNATFLDSDFVLGIGNRWANRHTGSIPTYTQGRKFVHIDIEPTQIGRVFCPDLGIVADAKYALEALIAAAREPALRGEFGYFNA